MSYAALAVGAVATLGFMVYAGQPESAVWFLGMLPFAAWALAPYGVLGWQAFVVEPDAQSALLFVFLPLWQLVYAVVVTAVARGLAAR